MLLLQGYLVDAAADVLPVQGCSLLHTAAIKSVATTTVGATIAQQRRTYVVPRPLAWQDMTTQ